LRAGAYGIAVISAVCCQKDPQTAAEALRRLLEAKINFQISRGRG